MSTPALIGHLGRDGVGAVTLVTHDGYPAGVGQALLDNWDDMDRSRVLVAQGTMVAMQMPPPMSGPGAWNRY